MEVPAARDDDRGCPLPGTLRALPAPPAEFKVEYEEGPPRRMVVTHPRYGRCDVPPCDWCGFVSGLSWLTSTAEAPVTEQVHEATVDYRGRAGATTVSLYDSHGFRRAAAWLGALASP